MLIEGLLYEVKQLGKQQEKFAVQLKQVVDNKQLDPCFPSSEFECDLPLDTEEMLDQLEDTLEDSAKMQSLVKFSYSLECIFHSYA
jgi:hypothetical protein